MVIVKDVDGPQESSRYVAFSDDGQLLDFYEGKEAAALSALLARKVSPDAVLDMLFGRTASQR
jgi:hypothetical protein